MKYSLPITGCLCLSCRGESCMGGAGAPEVSPPLCGPPLLPSVPPTWRGWWKQRGEADPATGGVALASDGLRHHALLASDQASDVLALSLRLLTYIMGSTTLPASQGEDAVNCQHKAASTDRVVRGHAGWVRPEGCLGMFQMRTREAE